MFQGVILDHKLCWKPSIKHVCNKMAKIIRILGKTRHILNNKTLHTLYYCFKKKYVEDGKLGRGGFGSVYAGRRKIDNLPVSITHIFLHLVHVATISHTNQSIPVLSVGAVTMQDWYELEREVLLVMERPVASVSLLNYMENNGTAPTLSRRLAP
uniref:non-specific serine/threonine protein kinase n=1 Tax=Amphilophus citrinellus TaxID=61819 RepID=A0A3Q0S302_AMPCI